MTEEPRPKNKFDIDAYLEGDHEAAKHLESASPSPGNSPYRLGLRIFVFIGISVLVTLLLGSIFFMYAMGASMSAGNGSASERTFMEALVYSYPIIIVVSGVLTFRK